MNFRTRYLTFNIQLTHSTYKWSSQTADFGTQRPILKWPFYAYTRCRIDNDILAKCEFYHVWIFKTKTATERFETVYFAHAASSVESPVIKSLLNVDFVLRCWLRFQTLNSFWERRAVSTKEYQMSKCYVTCGKYRHVDLVCVAFEYSLDYNLSLSVRTVL